MKLYYSPGACSFSPHVVLREAGLAVELVKVDLGTHRLPDGSDFAKVNPKGYVPVLELDNGKRLTEGPAIVQYIADLKPESGLAPKNGSFERYQLQEWLGFINSELHKGMGPLFSPNTPDDFKMAVRSTLGRRFAFVAERLDKSPYLMGEQFTVADAYLFTILSWCKWTGINLQQWPSLVAFQEKVSARPAVKAAQAAEKA